MNDETRVFAHRGEIYRLRAAQRADAEFQFDLFRANHGAMLASGGLPEATIDNLLAMQFRARAASYQEKFPHARRSILEAGDGPIGELIGELIVSEETDGALYIVDVALRPEWRGRGVGGALMRSVVASCGLDGGVRAMAALSNQPSRKMFARLGFVETGSDEVFVELRWRPS